MIRRSNPQIAATQEMINTKEKSLIFRNDVLKGKFTDEIVALELQSIINSEMIIAGWKEGETINIVKKYFESIR